jgi:hypothetical protein
MYTTTASNTVLRLQCIQQKCTDRQQRTQQEHALTLSTRYCAALTDLLTCTHSYRGAVLKATVADALEPLALPGGASVQLPADFLAQIEVQHHARHRSLSDAE